MQPKDPISSSDYDLPARYSKVVQPLNDNLPPGLALPRDGPNPAVSLLRTKISNLYAVEPDASQELAEAKAAVRHPSKHQQFMLALSSSGKPLAQIQTEWHLYYVNLPDQEKHQVWQEFYRNHAAISQPRPAPQITSVSAQPSVPHSTAARPQDRRSVAEIKAQLMDRIKQPTNQLASRGRSLLFGLGMGALVMVFLLFGLFNERFIAPLVSPSRTVSQTPLVIDADSTAIGPESKIIIPKINVEIPVIYDEPSINEAAVQRALEDGVLHYPITARPGEVGNGAIFGHSSNNILNRGKYKFAFVLLKELEPGDTFFVHKNGKRYIYRVFDKKVVKPTDLSVLEPVAGKAATLSLITCDPPGTSLNRLVVIGEQISPDPAANIASSAKRETGRPAELPSDAPTVWQRLRSWLTS